MQLSKMLFCSITTTILHVPCYWSHNTTILVVESYLQLQLELVLPLQILFGDSKLELFLWIENTLVNEHDLVYGYRSDIPASSCSFLSIWLVAGLARGSFWRHWVMMVMRRWSFPNSFSALAMYLWRRSTSRWRWGSKDSELQYVYGSSANIGVLADLVL